MPSKSDIEFLQTPGKLPWHYKPTRKKNPVSAVVYDAEDRLVSACAYGNAKKMVECVNAHSDLVNRLIKAEKFIHTMAFSAGRLDIVGGSQEQLLRIMRNVKAQLESDAESYWKEYGDSPIEEGAE